MGRKTIFVFILTFVLSIQSLLVGAQEIKLGKVPSEYKALYSELDKKLLEIDRQISSLWNGQKHPIDFSVELLGANGHRGEALLREDQFQALTLTLDRLQSLGVKGINLGILYPMLNFSFPRSSDYLSFYKKMASEIKKRDFKLIVETTTVFREPEFSQVRVDYSGLNIERYKQEKRQMVETVIKEIKPDYLTVDNEPLTQQHNTGLRIPLKSYIEMIQFILKDLDRSGIRIGAGAGTWDDLSYFESLAKHTNLDYIDMHLYPIQRDFLIDRTLKIAKLAQTYDKKLSVGEAWLYKAREKEFRDLMAIQAQIFSRDVFGFWIPLDEKYLEVMVKLSHYLRLEFCSFFWMRYLYGYVEYNQTTKNLKPLELFKQANGVAFRNIVSNTPSPTGRTFQKLIGDR